MIKKSVVNIKGAIEQWLKTQYTDGLTNEFNNQDSLINIMKRETLVGTTLKKQWALGVTDNVYAIGQSNDTFALGLDDFQGAGESVEGEFDTTKIMGTFAITDEVLVRGSNNGAIINVVKDALKKMQIGLDHKMKRFVYGGKNGIIGVTSIKNANAVWNASISKWVLTCDITNSKSVLPGMGLLLRIDGTTWMQAKIWQKDNTKMNTDTVICVIEKAHASVISDITASGATVAIEAAADTAREYTVYSRQLQYAGGTPEAEYQGLEDIVMTNNNTIFGIDRSVYKSLNCTVVDLALAENGGDGTEGLVTESILRDLSDHINDTANDTANINLVASKARIVSTLEKQMFQYKEYQINEGGKGFNLGKPEITFDQWQFHKDKFSRDHNVYLLDPDKIGELVRRDWTWLTSGTREGVLERRDGTEIWEGIMNKYADMYLEEWRVHSAFKNAAEDYAVV